MLQSPRVHALAMSLAAIQTLHAAEEPEGKGAYEINCKACHLIDSQTVGPSMIRVAKVYPRNKRSEFIEWAKNPRKKDPLAIEMPSMSHLSDDTLGSVHTYILKAVVGQKEKKGSPTFAKYREPKRKLPYVVHAFMPETNPASIAIVLPGGTSVCWDTVACRVRYAWMGSKTNIRAFRREADLESKPFHRETTVGPLLKIGKTEPRYHGYRLLDGYPEFHYSFGQTVVRELVRDASEPGSFTRRIRIERAPSTITLDLASAGEGALTTDSGSVEDGKLILSQKQASDFTLTVVRK